MCSERENCDIVTTKHDYIKKKCKKIVENTINVIYNQIAFAKR